MEMTCVIKYIVVLLTKYMKFILESSCFVSCPPMSVLLVMVLYWVTTVFLYISGQQMIRSQFSLTKNRDEAGQFHKKVNFTMNTFFIDFLYL